MKDLTKVVTGPNTRFSYANVWEPRKFKGDRAKYSICLIIRGCQEFCVFRLTNRI